MATVSLKVFVDLALKEDATEALGFRYNLFGNPTRTDVLQPSLAAEVLDETAVGATADEDVDPQKTASEMCWKRVSLPGEKVAAAAKVPGEDEAEDELEETPVELDYRGEQGMEKVAPALYRWECTHEVVTDDGFLLGLNQNSLCPFFVHRSDAAAAPPPLPSEPEKPPSRPGSKGKDAPPPEEPPSEKKGTEGMVNYHHATVLDLSSLLAGRISCSLAFGSHPTVDAWADEIEEGSEHVEGLDWLEKLLSTRNLSTFEPPPGVSYARVSVVVARDGLPLLTRPELDRLNPLSITVSSARDLPGVRLEAKSLKQYTQSSPYALQHQLCAPTYAVLQPLAPSLGPRLVATEGQSAGSGAVWEHTTCFLAGSDVVDRHVLEEALEHTPLRVEVHDRDPLAASGQQDLLARCERLVSGEEVLEKPAAVEDAVDEEGPGGEEGEGAAEAEVTPVVKEAETGMDVFEVDQFWLEETIKSWASAGDSFTHATSSFKLNGLLDQASLMASAFARTKTRRRQRIPSLHLKLQEALLPAKKRVVPKGGDDDWALMESEQLVRPPGQYLATDASVRMKITLHRPLRSLVENGGEFIGATTLAPRPFGRALFVFEYGNVPLLRAVMAAMDAINTKALGKTIQGSLRSHQLSPEQVEGAVAGTLDIVCGFQIIDSHCRMIALEGAVATVNRLLETVPREAANDAATRILANPDVAFHERLYTAFNVDLKKIRLREPLPILVELPELYNSAKVAPACFQALHKLQACRNASRLNEVAGQGLFPLDSQLLQVESKYGESISMEDIDGRKGAKKKAARSSSATMAVVSNGMPLPPGGSPQESNNMAPAVPSSQTEGGAGTAVEAALLATTMMQGGGGGGAAVSVRRKAPTDATNPKFEESKRNYQPPNFIQEQQEELEKSMAEFEVAKAATMAERAADPVPAKFVYSGQKLQYTELKKGEMRAKLGREKNTHFTYAQGYLAAAVSMVDETRLKKDQELESKAQWKTKRGFVYPAPKKVAEFAAHPHKPSTSRVEELKEPWVENEMHPLPVGRASVLQEGQPDFDTIPAQGKELFGGLHVPQYERPYDSQNVGSEQRLPRGKITLNANPDYFKSVHLTGAGLAEEKLAQKAAEEAAWQAKVVVDHLDFKVGGFNVRDRPLQMNRTDDVVKGPVKNKPLLMVRNAKLPSGKKVPLRPLPISAFSSEPYSDPRDFTADLRPDDFETFLATDNTGKHLDFVTAIHREINYPKSQCVVSHRSIPAMSESEKAGARWANQS